MFCYFNTRNFDILKYRSFYISLFRILTPTYFSAQNHQSFLRLVVQSFIAKRFVAWRARASTICIFEQSREMEFVSIILLNEIIEITKSKKTKSFTTIYRAHILSQLEAIVFKKISIGKGDASFTYLPGTKKVVDFHFHFQFQWKLFNRKL